MIICAITASYARPKAGGWRDIAKVHGLDVKQISRMASAFEHEDLRKAIAAGRPQPVKLGSSPSAAGKRTKVEVPSHKEATPPKVKKKAPPRKQAST
jgi:hypothetical protein